MVAQAALKFDLEVQAAGRLELSVPFPTGVHVTVFVVETPGESFDDLQAAAQTSLGFWDNAFDDEDWNNA